MRRVRDWHFCGLFSGFTFIKIVIFTLIPSCGGTGSGQDTPQAFQLSDPNLAVENELLVNNNYGDDQQSTTVESTNVEPSIRHPVTIVPIQWGVHSQQYAELYTPETEGENLPVVVMIHGGCWYSSYTLNLQAGLSLALAERGFAVWNIEYRSLGNGGEWPTMFSDVASATDFLPSIAHQYKLDLSSVISMGHSAGGHLALWLGSRNALSQNDILYSSQALTIKGVLSLAGITNLQAGVCGSASYAIIDAFGLPQDELFLRLASTSPIHMLPTGIQTTLISGSNDGIVPPSVSASYTAAAKKAGDSSEHIEIEDADHFYLINENLIDIDLLEKQLRRMLSQDDE